MGKPGDFGAQQARDILPRQALAFRTNTWVFFMLRWFDARIDPYPSAEPVQQPATMAGFFLFYLRGAKRWLLLMATLTAAIALSEVVMFGFIGNIVDWLGKADRATFLQTQGGTLLLMAMFVLVALPLVSALQSMVVNQTMMPNVPQRIRWMLHRWVLRQSMTYFQDEFAGRIATNLMQTALAIRDAAMKVFDVLNYVVFYFLGALVL